MATLDDVKTALRISHTAFDSEIADLILEAISDLKLSGVSELKVTDESDPLIKRAIKIYCKANFGFDNPDAERLQESYKMLKQHLCLAGDYNALA